VKNGGGDFFAKLGQKIPLKNGGFGAENLRPAAFFRNFATRLNRQPTRTADTKSRQADTRARQPNTKLRQAKNGRKGADNRGKILKYLIA